MVFGGRGFLLSVSRIMMIIPNERTRVEIVSKIEQPKDSPQCEIFAAKDFIKAIDFPDN
jgi:hypothetical protein